MIRNVYLVFVLILLFFLPVSFVLAGTVIIQYGGSVTEDASIESYIPSFNGGGNSWGNVTYFTSNQNIERTYIRIPLPAFITPSQAGGITEARLKVYFSGLEFANFDISVNEVIGNWEEDSITWENKPMHNPVPLDSITLYQDSIWVEFALTELVMEWIAGEKTNFGIVLKPLYELPPLQNLSVLQLSDNLTPSLRPILEISSPDFPDTFITNTPTYLEYRNIKNEIVSNFILFQNYPNPFNASTTISYIIPSSSFVLLGIYNNKGQRIKTLVKRNEDPGLKNIIWDGTNDMKNAVSSGIYWYSLSAGHFISSKKLLFLK